MTQNKHKIHYAWIVLIGCCLLQGCTFGAITNALGVYTAPVTKALGFSYTQMSLNRTIMGFVSMIALPIIVRLYRRVNFRLLLTVGALIYVIPLILMGTFHEIWQWQIASAIQGLTFSFLSVTIAPIVISNWFHKRTGLAIGLSSSSTGLFGALFNYLISSIIANHGWRAGYL